MIGSGEVTKSSDGEASNPSPVSPLSLTDVGGESPVRPDNGKTAETKPVPEVEVATVESITAKSADVENEDDDRAGTNDLPPPQSSPALQRAKKRRHPPSNTDDGGTPMSSGGKRKRTVSSTELL